MSSKSIMRCRCLWYSGISPIISALVLFLIVLAATAIAISIVSVRIAYVESLLDALNRGVEASFEEDLQIVYMATTSHGSVILGIMNTGSRDAKILAIYVNGSLIESANIYAQCRDEVRRMPIDIRIGELCLITVATKMRGRCYEVTIATEGGSYVFRVYAR